jgi:uncharacterized surface protein with fasciclin (FAS1) repeats
MPENIDMLRSILTYHVLPGNISASALSSGLTATTVQGDDVVFQKSGGKWYINNAEIIATDLMAGNGVVHVIDTVIMPKMSMADAALEVYDIRADMSEADEARVDMVLERYSELRDVYGAELDARFVALIDIYSMKSGISDRLMSMLELIKFEILTGNLMTNSIVDIAVASGVHETLVTAVVEAGLADTLSSDGPFTVFAPVDSAFAALPDGTIESLLAEESKESLTDILTYHVVPGTYFADDINDGLELTTVNGDSLYLKIENNKLKIN